MQSALGDSSGKGSAIEKQVLNLYDQLYQSYVLANSTTTSASQGPGLTDGRDLLNEVKIIVMENLETVVSVSQKTVCDTCYNAPHFSISPSLPPSLPPSHSLSLSL